MNREKLNLGNFLEKAEESEGDKLEKGGEKLKLARKGIDGALKRAENNYNF
ncbi:MAG: hypothetical protein ABIG60_04780 [Patescibacteria group bacterium]